MKIIKEIYVKLMQFSNMKTVKLAND